MNSRRRLQENIAALSVLQILGYVTPLLTVPYLVRVLKPSQFGLLSFAQGIVLYFDLLTDYGFNLSATRAIAAQRHESEAVSRIFWSTFCAKGILMLGSGIVLSLLVAFTPKLRDTPNLYAVSFLYVIGTALFPVWLFQGLEELKLAAVALGLARFLTVPALFLWVRHEQDVVVAAGIQASVQLTATILAAPVLFKRVAIRWYRPSFADVAQTFRAGWPLFIAGAVMHVCSSSTTLVLGFVAGRSEVGYYSAADKLIRAAVAVINPLSQALYPHITAARTSSARLALRLIRKSFVSVGLFSLAVSVGTLLLAGPICRLILGPSFAPSVYVLQWLSPLPFFFGLMDVFGTQTMLVFEMESMMSRIVLVSALAGIPLTVALSFLFGAQGAAAASTALAAAMLAAMAATLRLRGLHVWQGVPTETLA